MEDWLWRSTSVPILHALALSSFYQSFHLLLLIPLASSNSGASWGGKRKTFDVWSLSPVFEKKKRKERKESGLSNKIELSKAHKINHVRKMKGARRADGLRVCTASRALVCGPLKATVSAHHLTEVNGPTQAVDLLIFLHAWVTGWQSDTHTHIHRHPVRLSQSFLLSLSVSPSRTHSPAAENTWRRGHSFTCHTNKWHFR